MNRAKILDYLRIVVGITFALVMCLFCRDFISTPHKILSNPKVIVGTVKEYVDKETRTHNLSYLENNTYYVYNKVFVYTYDNVEYEVVTDVKSEPNISNKLLLVIDSKNPKSVIVLSDFLQANALLVGSFLMSLFVLVVELYELIILIKGKELDGKTSSTV